MLRSLVTFLREPYPVRTSYGRGVRLALLMSLFATLFLLAFQPFGIGSIGGEHRLLLIASYGLPCLAPLLFVHGLRVFIFRRSGLGERWRVWHEILASLSVVLAIGAANFTYHSLLLDIPFSWGALSEMLLNTALIGVFPIAALIAYTRAYLSRRHQGYADAINLSVQAAPATSPVPATQRPLVLTLCGENADEELAVPLEDVCFVKAEGNYVEVAVHSPGTARQVHLLRAALKDVEDQVARQCADIQRCHRSYLVNRRRVARAMGNAQGLTLHLDRGEIEVPVSRSFVASFR